MRLLATFCWHAKRQFGLRFVVARMGLLICAGWTTVEEQAEFTGISRGTLRLHHRELRRVLGVEETCHVPFRLWPLYLQSKADNIPKALPKTADRKAFGGLMGWWDYSDLGY